MKYTKKISFFILVLVLFSTTAFSQDKFFASVSMGKVFPFDQFASSNLESKNSGFSKDGFNLSIDGDYQLHRRWAASLRLNLMNTTFNEESVIQLLKNEMSSFAKATDSVQFDISYWLWISPMVGVKYNYPIIINKLYVEAGIFSGINFVQIPDQNVYFNDKEKERTVFSQNMGETDITFPLAANIAFLYRLNKRMQLKISSEYFSTRTAFDHKTFYRMNKGTEAVELSGYHVNVPIKTMNITLGLVYNL